MTYKTKGVNKMSNTQTICDCGCSYRGLTEIIIEGYEKNYEQTTFNTYDQKTKKTKTVTTDLYLDNQKHVFSYSLGHIDWLKESDKAIENGKLLIENLTIQYPNIDVWYIWSDDGVPEKLYTKKIS